MKNKSKSAGSPGLEGIAKRIETLESETTPQPILRRYKTNDATIEKLGEMLRDNPAGMLMLRDELVGLLHSWEKAGHEGDRTFYLEAWNGNASFDTDRIGRGSIVIPNLCVSILGGTQPDKLRALLEVISSAFANDGTLQRFQVLVYPDAVKWKWKDSTPDKLARDKVYELFEKMADFDPVMLGAVAADEFCRLPYFRFTPQAQEVFIRWSTQLHAAKILAEDNHLIAQHLGKFDKLFPALALIFHIVDCILTNSCGPVSEQAALRAAAWCQYLESHARRCYGLLADDGLCSAQHLADKIQKGKLEDGFTARDVQRHQWSRLTTTEAVQAALDWLEDSKWLRSSPAPSGTAGGRPTLIYRINPKIQPQRNTHVGKL